MKLSKWAKQEGIHYSTALKWFHNGTLPVPSKQLSTGTILVEDTKVNQNNELKTYVYSRVSSSNKKTDLESQKKLCEKFCLTKGWVVENSFKEVASGMNDNRKNLNKILELKNARIVCLHKDRLTRFGFNYIEMCVRANGGELVVINKSENCEDDLMKDLVTIITSFCCRLYGDRRGQAKALAVKEVIND